MYAGNSGCRTKERLFVLLLCLCAALPCTGVAQTTGAFKDEAALYAETKQVNQFFRRFNNEESIYGKRYYDTDKEYRSQAGREKYLRILFDAENPSIPRALKDSFIADVTDRQKPIFLDFHGGNWVAEVSTSFLWNKKEVNVTLFLTLQEEKVGSKWVISRVNFPAFRKLFNKDTTANKYFLHPLSHELGFMNLFRVFQDNKEHVEDYTAAAYEPDQLGMFLYELKKGNFQFKTITNVKFHFFQADNWYFELSRINRSGNNTGWLISSLVKANDREKNILRNYIYNKDE